MDLAYLLGLMVLPCTALAENWAVLVGASSSWHDYRHSSDVLAIYQEIKQKGITDSHIILMLAGSTPCDARNPFPGRQYEDNQMENDLGRKIETDYRGKEVTANSLYSVLTNRMDETIPRSKRLLSTEHDNVLLYVTGHGNDGLIKFQDNTFLTSKSLACAIDEMFQRRRYKNLLVVTDSCQSGTMGRYIRAPNVTCIGSAAKGQNSYSLTKHKDLGVATIDRFSWLATSMLRSNQDHTLQDLLSERHEQFLRSTAVGVSTHSQSIQLKLSDFFASKSPTIDLSLGDLTVLGAL